MCDGYLSDLAEAVKRGVIPPRDDVRRFFGLPTIELITEIDFSQALPEMIAAARNDRVDENITTENFPVVGNGVKRFRNKLFAFKSSVSPEDVITAMQKENFKAADHVHGFAFSAKFPNIQRQKKRLYACLGSFAMVHNHGVVVCFDGNEKIRGSRVACLLPLKGLWPAGWRFLGVQEISG